jgi:hypothetical protein
MEGALARHVRFRTGESRNRSGTFRLFEILPFIAVT